MKKWCFLISFLAGCTSTYKYGKVNKVEYAGYSYRDVFVKRPENVFPGYSGDVISNTKFCKNKSECRMAFDGQNQYFTYTTFIDKKDSNGERKRVYIYETYGADTNRDGIVNKGDLCTVYAYEPVEERLTKLIENVRYLDMESNVTSFTFIILYEENEERLLNQYSMRDLTKIHTVQRGLTRP